MHWIRSHRHFGGRLALFALALQLVLSFGHIHHDAFAGAAGIAAAAPQTAASNDTTADPDGHADKHDLCAICATIGLTASTVLPKHATPPLTVASSRMLTFELQTNPPAFQPDRFFQARAPPAVA